MMGDFSAVGGLLLVATGLRVCGNQNVSGSEYAPGAAAGDADLRRMGDVFCLTACNNNKVVIDCAVHVLI